MITLLLACTVTAGLPDRACTPGSFDPRVTQANIHQTICNTRYSAHGSWSRTWRPSVKVTNKLKAERAVAYGLALPLDCYEGDHEVPEAVGGCPGPLAPTVKPAGVRDGTWQVPAGKTWCDFRQNFWDQAWGSTGRCGKQPLSAFDKDVVEARIRSLVCSEKISLDEGQTALASDWVAAYRKYVGPIEGGK